MTRMLTILDYVAARSLREFEESGMGVALRRARRTEFWFGVAAAVGPAVVVLAAAVAGAW